MSITDFLCRELWLIRQLRLLQLPPFLLRRALFQIGFERQQPITDCGIFVDIDLALGGIYQKEAFWLYAPTLHGPSLQKALYPFLRLLASLSHPFTPRHI